MSGSNGSPDFLAFFGLGPEATEKDLKRAYARMIRHHRPDQDPDGFRRVQQAYEAAQAWFAGRPAPRSERAPRVPESGEEGSEGTRKSATSPDEVSSAGSAGVDDDDLLEAEDESENSHDLASWIDFHDISEQLNEAIVEVACGGDRAGLIALLERPDFVEHCRRHRFMRNLAARCASLFVIHDPDRATLIEELFIHDEFDDDDLEVIRYIERRSLGDMLESWSKYHRSRCPELVHFVNCADAVEHENLMIMFRGLSTAARKFPESHRAAFEDLHEDDRLFAFAWEIFGMLPEVDDEDLPRSTWERLERTLKGKGATGRYRFEAATLGPLTYLRPGISALVGICLLLFQRWVLGGLLVGSLFFYKRTRRNQAFRFYEKHLRPRLLSLMAKEKIPLVCLRRIIVGHDSEGRGMHRAGAFVTHDFSLDFLERVMTYDLRFSGKSPDLR